MDMAFVTPCPLKNCFRTSALRHRVFSRPLRRERSHVTNTRLLAVRCVASGSSPRFGAHVRNVLAAVSLPILPFLPMQNPPAYLSRTHAVILADARASSSYKSTSRSVQLATVPLAPTVRQGPVNLLRTIVPNSKDTKIHFALKCALLAAIASSIITAATIAVFWVIQDSLVYKPTKVWRGNPKLSGMPFYDDVNYCTVDGVEISGWFIMQPPKVYRNSRTLVYFHGTDKNASFRLKKVVGFYEQCKCNVLLLSYRGYGLSSGHPNERGMCIDAESALDYLSSRGDVDVSPGGNLWVYGESLGGAVAVHFTRVYQDRINALILENTFTSLLDMIKLEFPILGVFRYLSRNKWQSKRRIRDIKTPILFLSGLRDAYIPPLMMKQMHEMAKKSRFREFIEFEKGTHNRTWTMEGFYSSVASFMERVEVDTDSETQPAFASSDPTNFQGDDTGLMTAAV